MLRSGSDEGAHGALLAAAPGVRRTGPQVRGRVRLGGGGVRASSGTRVHTCARDGLRPAASRGRLVGMEQPRVVVEPVTGAGRRVRVGSEILGTAYGPEDVVEFLRRAGLDPDQIRLDDPTLIDWHGGGPDAWT